VNGEAISDVAVEGSLARMEQCGGATMTGRVEAEVQQFSASTCASLPRRGAAAYAGGPAGLDPLLNATVQTIVPALVRRKVQSQMLRGRRDSGRLG